MFDHDIVCACSCLHIIVHKSIDNRSTKCIIATLAFVLYPRMIILNIGSYQVITYECLTMMGMFTEHTQSMNINLVKYEYFQPHHIHGWSMIASI